MTDRKVGELSLERWVADLETVIDAAGIDHRIILFGVSQGAAVAIAYAVRHPERVESLVLYGGYAIGARWREDVDHVAAYKAIQELARIGWHKPNPAFRQVFTSRFIPEGTEEQVQWFNDLCQRTTTPEIATVVTGTLFLSPPSPLIRTMARLTTVRPPTLYYRDCIMGRVFTLLFSVSSYCVFLLAFLYLIAFLGNLQQTALAGAFPAVGGLVVYSIDSGRELTSFGMALAVNLCLIGLFGLQHSVMARPGFKQAWTRVVPQPLERSMIAIRYEERDLVSVHDEKYERYRQQVPMVVPLPKKLRGQPELGTSTINQLDPD